MTNKCHYPPVKHILKDTINSKNKKLLVARMFNKINFHGFATYL